MAEFWEEAFRKNQEMWGAQPAQSALMARDYFLKEGAKDILIPGIGYGRNAGVLLEADMAVTGIEISQTAIDLAWKHFGEDLKIHHGSVCDMPFNDDSYDGIFCYALIHLLGQVERQKLIKDCYKQLNEGGSMLFTVVSKDAEIYGKGTQIDTDRYELFGGVQMFFYDEKSIEAEFADVGLFKISKVEEVYPFYLIYSKKKGDSQ
ncbi:methyltransferase [Pelobium manganitolerans]|uniref:Methyltransferase n=1 Tax=Pelobium manganitolerans TaxID=1842495 RepID=A0A419S3F8_9SPHI|nr:class I SAM-dependent methyltransferase [Pelobium manganitolerans]RKD13828.1 methyltransferase [Pelobium manganitolerans]